MLYREIVAVCSEIRTEHINTLKKTIFVYFCPTSKLKENTQRLRIARSTRSTKLDASLPEDGSRFRLRNFAFIKNLDDGESKERKKEVLSVSRSPSSEPYSVFVNALCGQNVEFVSVRPGGTCSNDCTLKG
jgi:hypothetical protein